MAESTIDFNDPVKSPESRAASSELNYIAAQMATGLKLNQKISGQISSISMNIGKVISTSNNVVREVQISNDLLTKMNDGINNLDRSIKDLIGVVRKGEGTERTNRSVGNLSQRVTAMISRQDEMNAMLAKQFGINDKSSKDKYDSKEAEMEKAKDLVPDTLNKMSESLLSIDKTLKNIEKNGINGSGNSGSVVGDVIDTVTTAGAGLAALLSGAKKILKKAPLIGGVLTGIDEIYETGDVLKGVAKGGSFTAGAAYGASAGAGLGALGGPIAPVTIPLGAFVGGAIGGFGGSAAMDWLWDAPEKIAKDYGSSLGIPSMMNEEDKQRYKDIQFGLDSNGQYTMDGRDITREEYLQMEKELAQIGLKPNMNFEESSGASFEKTGRSNPGSAMDQQAMGEAMSRYWDSQRTQNMPVPKVILEAWSSTSGTSGFSSIDFKIVKFSGKRLHYIDGKLVEENAFNDTFYAVMGQPSPYDKTNRSKPKQTNSSPVTPSAENSVPVVSTSQSPTSIPVQPSSTVVNTSETMPSFPSLGEISNATNSSIQPSSTVVNTSETMPSFPSLGEISNATNSSIQPSSSVLTTEDVMPSFPSLGAISSTSTSFNTREALEEEQSRIEEQSKNITGGDILFESGEVVYKANSIRFEASSIEFLGAVGSAGGGGGGGGGGAGTTAGGGDSSSYDGNQSDSPTGAARLTEEERTAIDTLEKTGKYSPGINESTALGSLTNEQLDSLNIKRTEGRGAKGQTSYSYTKPEAGHADKIGGAAATGAMGPRAGLNKNSKLIDAEGSKTTSALGIDNRQYNSFREALAGIESRGGEYGIVGGAGNKYSGAYQFGSAAMKDAAKELGIPMPSREEFLKSPELQEKFLDAYTSQNHKTMMKLSPEYRDMSPEERLGVLGYAHNQGAGGAIEWMKTGKVGVDGFGTAGTKYTDAIKNQLEKTKNDGSGLASASLADKIGDMKPSNNIASNSSKEPTMAPEKLKLGDTSNLQNPNNAKLDRVDPQLMTVHNEAARRFEKENPNYDVEVYGPNSGVRTSGSTGNHGIQGHGYGGALDIRIKDKKTGEYLNNFQSGATAPIYQQYHNFSKLAQEKYFPDMNIRNGQYFASGSTALDSMHSDILGHKGMGGGSWEEGFTPAMMARFGIDPEKNIGMKEFREKYSYEKEEEQFKIAEQQKKEQEQARMEKDVVRQNSSVARTETMNREQARVNDGKMEAKKRENERITLAIQNREGPGPKNPKTERKTLDSTLVRHNDWWKNFSASA